MGPPGLGTGSSLGDYESHSRGLEGDKSQHLRNADEVMGNQGTGKQLLKQTD